MTRLAQLTLTSKTRGVIIWTFWENETNIHLSPFVASSVDAYGNTKRLEWKTKSAMRSGYQTLQQEYGYSAA